jgi:DNA-directed RNA polymerase specialized sigma24 family protein
MATMLKRLRLRKQTSTSTARLRQPSIFLALSVPSVTITQEQFDSLLAWLNADREVAGKKYETIRSGLVRIFAVKGFNDAEDLADETINRVMVRLPDIRGTYRGEPAYYFHGVARNVVRENRRRREVAADLRDIRVDPKPDTSDEQICLGHCLQRLPINKRDMILDYYLYEGHDKIEYRRSMARQLQITEGAFRSRAYQLRQNLADCMRQCASLKKGKQCPLRFSQPLNRRAS